MSHHDCQPYYLRTGDSWTKIDYSKKPSEWMHPLVKGQETGLVEIPANCESLVPRCVPGRCWERVI